MKYLVLLSFVCILFTSCSKDEPLVFFQEPVQRSIDSKKIKAYIDANNLMADSTSNGLYFVIEDSGKNKKPKLKDFVEVIYAGKLLDGTEFDSSNGNTAKFQLSNLIKGWQEGIKLFGKGGKGILIVPSQLGYGANSPAGIPSNSVLVFDIELVDF